MGLKRDKYVRFEDWSSERSSTPEQRVFSEEKLTVSSVMGSIRRGFEMAFTWAKSLKKSLNFHPTSKQPTKLSGSRRKVLDPQGPFLQQWNKIFVLSCIIGVSFDPLFLYIPVIDAKEKCLDLDYSIEITACVLRFFTDIFYILHIIFQFRTGFIAPPSRIFGRGELIKDSYAIAKRYLSSYFIIDILSVLPLPQVAVLVIIPSLDGPIPLATKDLLKFVIFVQYVPRLIRIYPLYKEVTRTSGIFTETAWAGAAFNLFLYMLASHVVGALWYLFTIEREDRCWHIACGNHNCTPRYLYCGESRVGNFSFLNVSCPLLQPNEIRNETDFDFGIFLDALQSRVVETRDFKQKFFYCFWWGLRGLSSLGQNLKTSTFVGEILFAVFISVVGLVLFSLLIGNMQKYLQSITVRVEEMRLKRRDAEQWMSHRLLPENLRERFGGMASTDGKKPEVLRKNLWFVTFLRTSGGT
ncbi:unnamed protein product [Ilex paraguariensis]|uniref:Ion transport domain-containing protein n=1 Tax=Ilex paraguariensis TaxID=185542 RepID=A0ABC8T903_9AQUA